MHKLLGQLLTVTVDRPLGSVHPDFKDTVYKVNYGYIDGLIAMDGDNLDAYVLGVNEPVDQFTGRVVAIIHRMDDIEEKLVVAPAGMRFNQAEIMEAVHFQEQYFDTTITCLYEKSCGAIIYRKNIEKIEFLLLFQHRSRTWSFPKGHANAFESEERTSLREVKEETGMTVFLVDGFRESLTYHLSGNREKEVVLFMAKEHQDIVIRNDEIEKYIWADKKTALELLIHKNYSGILDKVESKAGVENQTNQSIQ